MSLYFAYALTFLTFVPINSARMVLSLYALDLGAPPLTVGVLAATFSVFPMLLAVPAGKITDRFGSRWPVLIGTVFVFGGMLVPYFNPGLRALYIAAAMNGLAFSFFSVALQNLVGLLSAPQDRPQNFSNFSLMVSTANFFAPLFAGFAIDHSGYISACLYVALIPLAPMALLAIGGAALPGGTSAAAPAGSIRNTLADPAVRRVLATSSLIMLGQDLFQTYMPVYGHGIGMSASVIGVVVGMFSGAAFVVRIVLARLMARFSVPTLLAYSFYLGAATFILIPFFENAVVLGLLAFIFGLGSGCGQPIITMLMFSHSKEGRSGEALGLRITVNHLTRVVGPVVFGSIISLLGLPPLFWINALMLASGGVLSRPRK